MNELLAGIIGIIAVIAILSGSGRKQPESEERYTLEEADDGTMNVVDTETGETVCNGSEELCDQWIKEHE